MIEVEVVDILGTGYHFTCEKVEVKINKVSGISTLRCSSGDITSVFNMNNIIGYKTKGGEYERDTDIQ